ncbi:MAG: DNA recombination protein RecN, partial [Helicobacter sp.]|nr:DNA recombination protein RecN [Helicobacter sp.]
MIREILIKNSPVFKEIHLELSSGFNAFSGASGVGKSILMESILALFGHKDSNASVIEAHFDRALELEDWGIESEDETILSILKKDKTRYFINSQSLSKNRVIDITSGFVKYLGSRNAHIEEGYIRALLDSFIAQKSPDFAQALSAHAALFERTQSLEKELSALQQKEQQLEELKEFARFEIQKIESIAPESGEYDKLLAQKRLLSKAEKLGALAQLTDDFIDKADCAMQLLALVERDSAFLQEALLELRNIVEDEKERLEDLLEIDAGALLERISQLSDIRKRYGSEEQALEYLAHKKVELQSYENLEQSKLALEKELALSRQERDANSQKLHDARAAFLADFEGALNALLEIL